MVRRAPDQPLNASNDIPNCAHCHNVCRSAPGLIASDSATTVVGISVQVKASTLPMSERCARAVMTSASACARGVQVTQLYLVRTNAALLAATLGRPQVDDEGIAAPQLQSPSRRRWQCCCWSRQAIALLAVVLVQLLVPAAVAAGGNLRRWAAAEVNYPVIMTAAFLTMVAVARIASSCTCVLSCALALRAAADVSRCTAAVKDARGRAAGRPAAGAVLHSDGADASDDASCAIRALVPHTMNAAFAVIRLAQRLAACTFALLISNTIVLTIHLTSKVDVEYALAIINVLLPVLGMCIIVCGVRVTDALRELHMTVVDPVSSVSAGPAEARAARDVGTYLQVLDAKVSVACIAHFMVVSRRGGIGPSLLCAQGELAFQVFGIAVTWTNMGTAAVSVGTAAVGWYSWQSSADGGG